MSEAESNAQQIESILGSSWEKFEAWREGSGTSQSLAIPPELTSVFIPRRIMELAQNPANLRTISFESQEDKLRFMIVETFDDPVSDPEIYRRWREENDLLLRRTRTSEEVLKTKPSEIDYKHALEINLLDKGLISLKDKVLLEYMADVKSDFPNIVETRNLFDRVDMQRMGVGTSFYQRLEDVFRALGFKYIVGKVISRHPDFFAKTRTHYRDLPPETKQELPTEYAFNGMGDIMVKVL